MQTARGRALTPARGTLLRVQRSSKLSAAAVAATITCFATLALDLAGFGIHTEVTRGLALAAAPLALALAIRTAAAIWRGPALMRFPVEYAVLCRGAEAEAIRAAAHVRGSLGGAGYVRRSRLVIPLLAWALAGTALACVAAGALDRPARLEGMALLALAVAARFLFPARPFWYREGLLDGSLVLYPPSVAAHVNARRG